MATRDELILALAKRRLNNFYWPNFDRAQIKQAAQQLSDEEWDRIVAAMRGKDHTEVGAVLTIQVQDYLMSLAVTEVTTWLADDLITTDQLLELI